MTAQSLSVPAPVGGWNARDPIANMPATDALVLDNWFPTPADVRVRGGREAWATGISGQVESLLKYASTTTSKLFAAAGGNVYDVTSSGAVGAAVTTFSTSRIQSENFTTAAGNYLICCTGSDAPQTYNGSVWATPSITGVTGGASTLVQPCAFKSRLFFTQTDSLSVWYLAVNSIAGSATEFALGGVFQDGGYLVAMGTWTLDAGSGADDHAVFVTSKGEVAVYAGTDPTSADDWRLIGVYRIGSPIGRRCLAKYSGDLLIICQDGVFPLSSALQSARVDVTVAITDKIRSVVNQSATSYKNVFGWQVLQYPKESAVILNVPTSSTVSYQYVMNSITGAWCRFTNWNASCFAVFSDDLYYGGLNTVYKAWTGYDDDGTDIDSDAKTAFNNFGAPSRKKHFKMVKMFVGTNGSFAPGIILNVDYADQRVTGVGAAIPLSSGIWGVSLWGSGTWGGGLQTIARWQKVTGVGYCASLRVSGKTNGSQLRWYSTDYMVEVGGIL